MKLFFTFIFFISSFFSFNYLSANNQDLYKKLEVFGDVFDIIKQDYVEEINDEEVIELSLIHI